MPLVLDPLAYLLSSRIRLVRRPSWDPDLRSHVLIIVFGFYRVDEVEQLERVCSESYLVPEGMYGFFRRPDEVHIITAGFQYPDDRIEQQSDWVGIRQYLDPSPRLSSMYHVYVMRHWVEQRGREEINPDGQRRVCAEVRLPRTLSEFVAVESRLHRLRAEAGEAPCVTDADP